MLFINSIVLTINGENEIIPNGAIRVSGTKISDVGSCDDIIKRYPNDEIINCNGGILMPGLIDCHVHTSQAIIRGCADDLGLVDWLTKRVWPLQAVYSEEDAAASARLCILEMIKSGTTSFVECMLAERFGFDGIAEVVLESGIRASLARVVMDNSGYANKTNALSETLFETSTSGLKAIHDAYGKWHGAGDGRIKVWIAPRSPGSISPETYKKIADLASDLDVGITMHLADAQEEVDYTSTLGFRSPVAFALANNLLGPRSLMAHCVRTDSEDWKILAETGTKVVHNPAANAKCATGIAPIQGMLNAGVCVCLGCDGGPSNNTYDILRDLRLTSYLAKLREDNPSFLTAEQVVEMATIRGAEAIGQADMVGSIEIGKEADFIIIDTDKPHLTPIWDPFSTVAFSANGSDVDTVVIAGKMVMQHREVNTLNEKTIVNEARSRSNQIALRSKIQIRPSWPH